MNAATGNEVRATSGSQRLRAWVIACRPATLTAAVSPVLVGCGVAAALERFAFGPALAALLGAIAIQIGTNLANDVYDFQKGADTEARLGPLRAVQAGLLSPEQVQRGMWVAFGFATLMGVYLTAVAGWPVVAIGAASIASGIAYTGGPYPLGYHGLGDVFVLVFFGFVAVCGTVFVQAHELPATAWFAALAPGAIATAVLVVNNLRDREQDAIAGKRTLAVRYGERATLLEYGVLLCVAEVVPPAMALDGLASPWAFLPFATMPWASWLLQRVVSRRGRDLNPLLKQTALLLFVHSILFAVGLAAAGISAQ